MDITWFVGNLALVCTVASNLAGLQVCMKFTKTGTTQTISALPFIAGLTCTSLWLHYGTNVKDFVLIAVNFVAVLLQSCYILWYYLYTKNKSVIHSQLLIIGSFLASAFTYSLYIAENQQVATNVIGLLACGGSLFACAAPLSSVKEVLRTKSTDSLPFLIIFASFIVTSLWFSYGMLVKDTFLQIPNFFGALLSGFQLCLFIIYPMKKLKLYYIAGCLQLVAAGREDGKHLQGVGLLLSRHISDALLGYDCINKIFLTAKFKMKIKDLNVICCNTPTEDSDENENNKFYRQLQDVLNAKKGDISLVLVGALELWAMVLVSSALEFQWQWETPSAGSWLDTT